MTGWFGVHSGRERGAPSREGDVTLGDILVARRMLESEAAALAAQNRSKADVDRMLSILDEADRTEDPILRGALDLALHEAIIVASGNPVLQIEFDTIRELVHAMIVHSARDASVCRKGRSMQRTIVQLISARNAPAAREEMITLVEFVSVAAGGRADEPLIAIAPGGVSRHVDIA